MQSEALPSRREDTPPKTQAAAGRSPAAVGKDYGAAGGNRTRAVCLGSRCATITPQRRETGVPAELPGRAPPVAVRAPHVARAQLIEYSTPRLVPYQLGD